MAKKFFSDDEEVEDFSDESLKEFDYLMMNFYTEPECPACMQVVPDRCEYVWQAAQCPNKIKHQIKTFLQKHKAKLDD